MNPYAMAFVIVFLNAAFGLTAKQRFELLTTGRPEVRWDRIGERLRGVVEYALAQRKMHYYRTAGLAHMLIFTGFGVLLLRTLILWGRGFVPDFGLFVLGHGQPLGAVYDLLKDIIALLVITGASTFIYFRTVKKQARMTLSGEGLLILGIIVTMMVSDILYDGSMYALSGKVSQLCNMPPTTVLGARPEAVFCERAQDVVAPLGHDAGKTIGFLWQSRHRGVVPWFLVCFPLWAELMRLVLAFSWQVPQSTAVIGVLCGWSSALKPSWQSTQASVPKALPARAMRWCTTASAIATLLHCYSASTS